VLVIMEITEFEELETARRKSDENASGSAISGRGTGSISSQRGS